MTPELSIIIPTLDEATTLPLLLSNLARQEGIDAELIFSDGGSVDGSTEIVRNCAVSCPFPVVLVEGPPGRGAQLNRGAEHSTAATLLFLHADSSFDDVQALRKALDELKEKTAEAGSTEAAARFRLVFTRGTPEPSFGYFYMQQKARLCRRHCIHGDQGYLLSKDLFRKAGGFPESLPVGEDTIFAEKIAEMGKWLLVSSSIATSARRFEKEGVKERQIINAVLLYLIQAGQYQAVRELPQLYEVHKSAGRLQLANLLHSLETMLAGSSSMDLARLWYRVGCYIRENQWQLPFMLDAWLSYRRDPVSEKVGGTFLTFYDSFFDRFTDNAPGRAAAAAVGFIFFRMVNLGAGKRG